MDRTVTLKILGDTLDVRSAVNWVNAEGDKIDARKPTLKFNGDTSAAMNKMAALRAAVAAVTDHTNTLKFTVGDAQYNATLAAMLAKLTAFQAMANRPILSDKMLAQTKAGVLGLAAAFDVLKAKEQDAVDAAHQAALDEAHSAAIGQNRKFDTSSAAAVTGLAAGGATGGGGFFGLGGTTTLFGGLATTKIWHFAAAALTELLAVAVPATVAVAAFGASLALTGPIVEMMYQRETAMYTATDILGQKMPGITHGLNDFTTALKPGVFQVWGDILTVINRNGGMMAGWAQTAVAWVDKLAAKITVGLGNSSGVMHQLMMTGVHDLSLLGTVFGNVGSLIGRFFQVAQTTHIAEDLLTIVAAAAKVADVIARFIPTPILATAVAVHALYTWGGKLVDIIPGASKLVGVFDGIAAKALSASTGLDFTVKGLRGVATDAGGATVKTGLFKSGLALLSQVPVWGWVAAGAIALGGLVWWLNRGTDATTQWTQSLNRAISSANNNSVFNLMATDLGRVTSRLTETTKSLDATAKGYKAAGSGASAAYRLIASTAPAIAAQSALSSETQHIITGMNNFGQGVGWVMSTFKVGYPEAIAIATQAGVNLSNGITGMSKAAQDARQQIIGLMTGFSQLQTPAGIAGKDFEALAFASNDITSKIQQLNSAWDQWLKTVTGPQASLDTFAQGLDVLNQQSANFTLHLGVMTLKGTQAKAGIDSMTISGVNLNQAFMQEAGNLSSLEGTMRSANATQAQQTTTMKAGIAALIPFAKGSKEATSVLYALAQQADYTGKNSIAGLSSWAGIKAPAALGIMKKSSDGATKAASDLASAIQNLLNVQFQQDVIEASGASAALKKYTTDIVNNRDQTRQGSTDRQNLINDLIKAGVKADVARGYVDGLTRSLGRVPANTNADLSLIGTAHGGITITGTGTASGTGGIKLTSLARGGMVSGGTPGRDSVLINAMPGELVVPTHLVPAVRPVLGGQIPGFASGGVIGTVPGLTRNLPGVVPAVTRIEENLAAKAIKTLAAEAVNAIKASMTGSGSDIVGYALSFLGKIPYVWGAASASAADCSGFVELVYNKFGIHPPRTSEAQGAWVKRGPPTPGGLAFYHSPAGGADPGHVAIVENSGTVISQGGGMGPRLMAINGLPLLWTGSPPGGFGSSAGTTGGIMSPAAIQSLWRQLGGASSAAVNMSQIALAESGDNPSIIQSGQPQGLTGWGLYQITPTSGITQNGRFGNLLNASNNTRAAIMLFNASGYQPWAADAVGASLTGRNVGGGRHIQRFAAGGVIAEPVAGYGLRSGMNYSFGEQGAELVTPLSAAGYRGATAGDTNICITVNAGDCVDPNAVGKAIHQVLRRYRTKKGGIPLGLG